MEVVREAQLKNILENGKGIVVVDFFAEWCGPCKMFAPVLEQVAKEKPDWTVVKLDIDQDMDFAMSMSVVAVPTMVVFEDGEEIARTQGFLSKEDVIAAVGR